MDRIINKSGELLSRMQGRKVIVVGDLMIDQYIWGDVARVSPEAPVPIVGVSRETLRLGGAANVANNVKALGGAVEICGLAGDDQMGRWLIRDLEKQMMGVRGIILDDNRPTTLKTRVIAHNQQVVRFDREVAAPLARETEESILGMITSLLPESGAIIISDYAKGVISPTLLKRVTDIAAGADMPVAVDPKSSHFAMYRGVTVLTPNLFEAAAGAGMVIGSIADLEEAGNRIVEKLGCPYLLITRGDQGMTLFTRGQKALHIPAVSREVYDVTGAGDTVVATLALALAADISMYESAWLSNVAAGVVVGEVGTVTISREQMTARFGELAASGR